MAIHKLKTVQPFFTHVKEGKKKFEFRKNDRDFKFGDLLILEEYDPEEAALNPKSNDGGYTGKAFVVRVDYILQSDFPGIEKDYCVMGITKTKL